jgi:hypothetical protein
VSYIEKLLIIVLTLKFMLFLLDQTKYMHVCNAVITKNGLSQNEQTEKNDEM